ncbi:hypothetical protein [Streptomyces sp. NRRL F-5135]|uniref:hypothetical protein n=1 Tax=Streptomyces sp. NRRL F-5135 TaxID=1463858 RepID=UPI000B2312C1|nr:hypothetical protein [Streptomyces sp. NRRL F-5135]
MAKTSRSFNFPSDLLDLQAELQQTPDRYTQLCSELPWSVEPMPGWQDEQRAQSSYRSSMPDSPGYTDEQKQQVTELRRRLVDLSAAVITHEFWEGLDDVVTARMALKQAHATP